MDLHRYIEVTAGAQSAAIGFRHWTDQGARLGWRITVASPDRILRSLLVIGGLRQAHAVIAAEGNGNQKFERLLQGELACHRDVLALMTPTRAIVKVTGFTVEACFGITTDRWGGAGVVLLDPDEAPGWIAGFKSFERGEPRHGGAESASGGATGSRSPLVTHTESEKA